MAAEKWRLSSESRYVAADGNPPPNFHGGVARRLAERHPGGHGISMAAFQRLSSESRYAVAADGNPPLNFHGGVARRLAGRPPGAHGISAAFFRKPLRVSARFVL
jgi:hypothetical protein